jgi:hypothetical protein
VTVVAESLDADQDISSIWRENVWHKNEMFLK